MLYLIGLGLWDEKDLTQRALETIKKCDEVYIEKYTSRLMGTNKEKMEEIIGKKIIGLNREDVEGKTKFLKKDKDIAILVGGDPMVATTHSDLVLRAWEKSIETKIIHNASIFSAIAESGLQIYKFGRTATVTFWEKNFKPESFYDVVEENLSKGNHTLLLLDIKPPNYMTPNQAIEIMSTIQPNFLNKEIVIMSRVGAPDSSIMFGKASELKKIDFGGPLHVIIVPGKMHDLEASYLKHFRKP